MNETNGLSEYGSWFWARLQEVAKSNVIGAIKMLREQVPMGLKDAKDVIDAMRAQMGITPFASPPTPKPVAPTKRKKAVSR